jgi:DNA-binding NtrC family response regulator
MTYLEFPTTPSLLTGTPRETQTSPARPPRRAQKFPTPSGLVVSADDSIRHSLADALLHCGLMPSFALTLDQAATHIAARDLSFVLCQDTLPDGKYGDLLLLQHAVRNYTPLIVISPTGDWPEYFEAVDLGAHDFLAYPLIPGELHRIMRSFLDRRRSA